MDDDNEESEVVGEYADVVPPDEHFKEMLLMINDKYGEQIINSSKPVPSTSNSIRKVHKSRPRHTTHQVSQKEINDFIDKAIQGESNRTAKNQSSNPQGEEDDNSR
jgi:hypothetical protein